MALKSKITDKAEFDALPDVVKAEYKEEGGVWLLQADGLDDLRGLLSTERDARKKLEDDVKAAKAAADKAAADKAEAERLASEEAARKAGDTAALEKSYQDRIEEAKKEGQAEAKRLRSMLENLLVENEAIKLASEISKSPSLLLPVIRARLRAELDGETPLTRVLDATGKPSAANIADLRKELVENPEYAAIIIGSKANGGGANGQHSGGGAAKKISEMTETERVSHHKAIGQDAFRAQAKAEGIRGYA